MAARRPWRTAAFADLSRDGSDDDEAMPDARADVRGISVDFRKPKDPDEKKDKDPATPTPTGSDLYLDGISVYSKNESTNAKTFLTLLDKLKMFPDEGSIVPGDTFRISFTDLLNPISAWKAMKILMYNFHANADFEAELKDVPSSRVKEIVTGIVKKKYDRIVGEFKALRLGLFVIENRKAGVYFTPEVRESASPLNVIELKSIIDAINVAAANIKNEGSQKHADVSKHEPPFFPRLSEDERMMVWNWVNIKQTAVETIYQDAFYKFATLVAGMVNLTGFGIDKLITSAFKQTPTVREYRQMPSTIADDPFLSAERDALFSKIVSLNEQLRKSKIRDGLRQQRINNKIGEGRPDIKRRVGDSEPTFFEEVYDAVGTELPSLKAPLYNMDQEHPKSDETRELELHIKALEGLTDAFVSENSRQRMLWAVKWMMQPEILEKAEIEPIFASAMAQALYRVRQMCPSLRNVTDAKMFYESPDSMVVTAFAELVSQQITRTQFFHQTRVMLDKTHDRNQQMENRLKWTMQKFRFDGTHVLSEFSLSSSSETCSALYAF